MRGVATKIPLALFSTVALVAIIGAMVTYIASMAAGLGLFFFTTDGIELSARHLASVPLNIFVAVPVTFPIQPSVGEVFFVLWVVYVLCFAIAWYDFGGFHRSIRTDFWQPLTFSKINFLRGLPLIGAGLLSAVLIIHSVQESQGVGTGGLSFRTPLEALFNLAYSPISEEIAFRITPLGAASAVVVLLLGRGRQPRFAGWTGALKLAFLAFLAPQKARALAGLPTIQSSGWKHGVSWPEWILAIAISAMFGLAHILVGGGWEPGKATTAALSGFVLALVFFSHGAYAPILLHWFFNYYFMAVDLIGRNYPVLSFVVSVTNLVTVWFGILVLIAWAINRIAPIFFHTESTGPGTVPSASTPTI